MFLAMMNVLFTTLAAVSILFVLPYLIILFAVAAGIH